MARKPTSRQLAITIARMCEEKKADNIVVLSIGKLTFVTDYFVVATTQNTRQSRAILEDLGRTLKPKGIQILGSAGLRDSKWALLDYGDVVLHLFLGENREFYDLESHWADAPHVRWKLARPRKKKKAN